MGLWKIAVAGIFYFLSSFFNEAICQKKWDGEAGDGSWESERNWYPDGVPDSSTAVILDNTILNSSYTIRISSDTSPIKLHSLIIQPLIGNSIIVEIPAINKAVPALSLFSNKLSIIIGKGGILVNKSSASAGNTILMNGKIRIEDGGTYSHQTMRGNAYIITKLESSSGTEQGVVEFDVPGNTSYPISVSGRQYGSILLNSRSKEKKTYTGGGSNDLIIRGDLLVEDSVHFNSSLTGNMFLSGNIINKGVISINPTSADSINRELVFIGDASVYYSPGTLLLGDNFNTMRLKRGALFLRSSVPIHSPKSSFIIDPYSRLMMDTFCVYGNGQFKADSNAVLGIASPDGISINSLIGNIRTPYKNINPTTSFIFYGDQEQVTGSAFPISVSNLEINKTRGFLRLSLPLTINDSLILSKGILYSSASEPLTLLGTGYSKEINEFGWSCGGDSSFIDGPLRVGLNNSSIIHFPVGRNRLFAPLTINIGNALNQTVVAEYFNSLKVDPNNIALPLRSFTHTGYWKIKTIDDLYTATQEVVVQLGVKTQQYNPPFSQHFIAMADSVASNWNIIENSSYDQSANTASGKIPLKDAVLSLGSTQEEILSTKRIDLTFRKVDDLVALKWTIHGDIKLNEMHLEKSVDGLTYTTSSRYTDQQHLTNQHQYEKNVWLDDHPENFFRIAGYDEANNRVVSNIVSVKNHKIIYHPYPNPASNEIMIRLSEDDVKRKLSVELIDNTGRIKPVSLTRIGKTLTVNTSRLTQGVYRIKIYGHAEKKTYTFLKN